MHPAEIIALLRIHTTSGAEIARRLGVTRSTVHKVIHQRTKSRRVADAISRATKRPLDALFGDTYKAKRRAA